MAAKASTAAHITTQLRGRELVQARRDKPNKLALHFLDGSVLIVAAATEPLELKVARAAMDRADKSQPTKRQLEYLVFIEKYISRFGRAPAESDIEKHFLVSAPSVNQMMQTLERRGFIQRKPNTPRSTQICVKLEGIQSKVAPQ